MFIRQQQVQIVQTFFESSDLWAGLVVKATSDAKLVWSRRDMGILRATKHRLAYRLMANLPDAVFAVSEQVRQHSIKVDHIDPARVQTIYNGLDLSQWNAIAIPEIAAPNIRVVTLGNIRRVKGLDLLIRAAESIVPRFPNASFFIAGEVLEKDYFEELQTLVRDLGLSDRFHFIGGIPDPHQYFSTADIFVLPSRSEGFSNAIIEAMAASLPVVATNVGGNSEAVKDGVSGLLVPAEDPAQLAVAICQLLSSRSEAKAMGAAGRSIVAENFTTEAMMKRITSAYTNLLSIK